MKFAHPNRHGKRIRVLPKANMGTVRSLQVGLRSFYEAKGVITTWNRDISEPARC